MGSSIGSIGGLFKGGGSGGLGGLAGGFLGPLGALPGAPDLLGLGSLEGAPRTPAGNVSIRGAGGGGINIIRDPVTGEVRQVTEQESEFGRGFREGGERLGLGLGGQAETILGQVAGPEDIATQSFQAAQARLEPGFQERERDIRNRLAQQGIPVGSEAFQSELDRFERSKNAALQQAAFGAQQAGRQARATDIGALGSLLQSRGGLAPGDRTLQLARLAGLGSQFGTAAGEQKEFEAQQQRLGAAIGVGSGLLQKGLTGGLGG